MFISVGPTKKAVIRGGEMGHVLKTTTSLVATACGAIESGHLTLRLQYFTAEWEPAFLRQAREFPFFPLLPRETSK